MKFSRPTFAEIDLSAIRHNVRGIRQLVGNSVRILAAVKANGYGHGAVPSARACLAGGANDLGVASVDEGAELRENGIEVPILILGATLPEEAGAILSARLTPTVVCREVATALSQEAIRRQCGIDIHVKLDTGMGRIGVWHEDALQFLEWITSQEGLNVTGVYTHFASADEVDQTFTRSQLDPFSKVVAALRSRGMKFLAHTANSGAILNLRESYLDMVRPGLILYGAYPSSHVERTIPLTPAGSLKSRITFLKAAPAGRTISYGRTYATTRPTVIATVPVGYADGYARGFSNRGQVLIRGKRNPIVGRVCMDQCLVDVGGIDDVQLGEEVTFFGRSSDGATLPVEEVAATIGTIPNEIFCAVTQRVPRVYVG